MADIQIIIGYETVTQADQAFKILDKTVKSTARQYEQAFNKITGWQKKFSNEQNKVNASLNSQHLAQQKSNKSARDSAKAFEDAARAVEKEAAALRNLRMATDVVYRNQQKRLKMKKLLKSAIAAETMTTEQAIVALKKYNAAQATSNKVMVQAKNRMNGNNMAIQQLGYQFGDFAVQVQGGTSAFVAFSQQGAQLAGILPMIAGPLGLTMGAAVGLSAALGIIIPIVGAVGRLLFETGTKAKEAADKLKGSWADVPDLFEGLAEGIATPFDEAFDKIEGKYSKLIERFERAKLDAMKNGFQLSGVTISDTKASSGNKFNTGMMGTTRKLLPFGEFLPETDAEKRVDRDKRRQAQVNQGMRDIESIVKNATDLESALLDIQKQLEFIALVDKGAADALSLQLEEQGFIAAAVRVTKEEQEKLTEETNNTSKSQEKLLGFLNKTLDSLDEANAAQEVANQTLLDKNILLRIEKDHGKESLKYKQAAHNQDVLALTAKLKAKGIDQDLINFAVSQLDVQRQITGEMEEQDRLNLAMIERSSKSTKGAGYEALGNAYAEMALTAATGMGYVAPKGKTKTGSKKPPKDPIAEFQKKLDLERELLNVSEARQKVLQALGSDIVAKNPKIVAGMEAQITKTNELIALEDERQGIIDSITSSMETGFMAMIDGTMSVKDAFKSMAAAIIRELLQVMVVQKAVAGLQMIFGGGGLFGGASWSANGDVVGKTGIQAYADGGVVSGATMFQHGGGLGVMGEAGPEAIMPLKRGANGKLGVQMEGSGGGDTYVTNNYSISANTSEDTKRLVTQTIQQATPIITANTKASILNDRRRGGQMKSVFG